MRPPGNRTGLDLTLPKPLPHHLSLFLSLPPITLSLPSPLLSFIIFHYGQVFSPRWGKSSLPVPAPYTPSISPAKIKNVFPAVSIYHIQGRMLIGSAVVTCPPIEPITDDAWRTELNDWSDLRHMSLSLARSVIRRDSQKCAGWSFLNISTSVKHAHQYPQAPRTWS